MSDKVIILWNPHDEQYKMFTYEPDRTPYAPNYGCPIATGRTYQECLDYGCAMWDIDPEDVVE